jgi:hypothetical protein
VKPLAPTTPDSVEQHSDDARVLLAVANLLGEVGEALAAGGFETAARRLYVATSEIELQAEVGDEWWTGPFNRQEGRSRLFLEILETLRPSVLVETGTFKGTTTQFMAEVFPGRILTCEINHRWFIEAQGRLAQYPNVELKHGDSRAFLREVSRAVGSHERVFFYLDAHWLDDLPLRAEMELILGAWPNAVVMVDDFQVPEDAGYAFDNYGLGNALTLEIIRDLNRDQISVFFPSLPSEQETGAKRGCVVLASSVEAAETLHRVAALRHFPWSQIHATLPVTADTSKSHSQAERAAVMPADPLGALRAIVARLTTIPGLHARIAEIEADREARLAAIQGLYARIAEIEADWEARLAAIQGLYARIAEIEADREARLAVIQGLHARIAEIEADREARLAVIQGLHARIAEIEADREARQFQELFARHDALVDELNVLYASTSWRITAPLRHISGLIRTIGNP